MQDEFKRALATSFRILSRKQYSKKEIKDKLIGFEYDAQIVFEVLEKLDEMKLLCDEDYAKTIIEYYKNKGAGALKIKEELYKRGIPADIIKESLESFEVDFDIILTLLDRKLNGNISEYKNIEKAKAFLHRKGFSFDEINRGYSLYKEKLEED